ncbi:hypothetical protein A6070_04030 [Syntrophotalea acetylenica]|nr:hypothetical protein A6070_04030 [Syntrophotalea acetylenica]
MNLIEDAWLPVLREEGPDKIAPWQIVETTNPVLEITAPRPDFQGALYQFLIGLLQTCFAPEDHDEWLEYWDEMPTVDQLRGCFQKVSSAFELENPDGPAFMQDFNDFDGEELPIEDLIGGLLAIQRDQKIGICLLKEEQFQLFLLIGRQLHCSTYRRQVFWLGDNIELDFGEMVPLLHWFCPHIRTQLCGENYG